MESITNVLTTGEIYKIQKLYKYERDIFHHITSLFLQKRMISTHFDIDYHHIIIEYNSFGKPYFRNTQDFEYNISHDKDCVVGICGYSKMGIDIMHLNNQINIEIFNKLSENILSMIHNSNVPQFKMIQLWTLIESYFKALGIGLHYDFNNLLINDNTIQYLKYDKFQYMYLEYDQYLICICF